MANKSVGQFLVEEGEQLSIGEQRLVFVKEGILNEKECGTSNSW